jgi:hypothetical protein
VSSALLRATGSRKRGRVAGTGAKNRARGVLCLNPFGSPLRLFGLVWVCLGLFGIVWVALGEYGPRACWRRDCDNSHQAVLDGRVIDRHRVRASGARALLKVGGHAYVVSCTIAWRLGDMVIRATGLCMLSSTTHCKVHVTRRSFDWPLLYHTACKHVDHLHNAT